jgi:hypothetical protein
VTPANVTVMASSKWHAVRHEAETQTLQPKMSPCWPCKNRNRPVEPVGGLQKNRNFRFWRCFGSINRQKIG